MDTISYTKARKNLACTVEKVCDDHNPLIITRKSNRPVVMLSLEDYQAMEETTYLLRSPKNAKRPVNAVRFPCSQRPHSKSCFFNVIH